MKRLVLLVGLLVFAGTASAQASGPIHITLIQYNSPGPDNGSNPSLNAEYIVLKNVGAKAVKLTGWTVRDSSNHVYKFGTFTLFAANKVTIHTGKASNTRHDRYWGQSQYVWNNDGDTATVKRANGTVADRCSYGGGGTSVSC
jgi:Lamin Tail Domain